MELMSQEQQKTYRWGDEEHPSSVTYSLRGVPTINEPALRKELGAKVYDKYTKRVLDRKAMERAMDMGLIDPVTVSKHVSMTYTRVLTFREK